MSDSMGAVKGRKGRKLKQVTLRALSETLAILRVRLSKPTPGKTPEFPQKYFKKMENFRRRANDHQRAMIYHAIHHNFTTKTPHQKLTFSKTPSKNAHKAPKTNLPRRPKFFLK